MKPSSIEYPEWQYRPFWLKAEDLKDPVSVLEHFFETFSLPVCRDNLWEMIMGFMNSELADDLDRNDRSDMLYFYRGLGELVEAASIINYNRGNNSLSGTRL